MGQRPIDFIERYCRHSKGKFAGKPFRLDLFQKAKLQLVFGWLERDTDLRRFTEVIDLRGRKNGKSTETAGVQLYALTSDGEAGAEVYCAANKRDQSKIIFDEGANMRLQSPELRAVTRKRQNDIYYPRTMSILKALAADTKTMDGLNASFFSLDEFHEMQTSKIYDVLRQSQTSRDEPLSWLISTNGFVREGFFDNTYTNASKIALWEEGFQDMRTLALLYELNDRSTWADPAHWIEANPGLGSIKSVKALKENVEKAKRDPTYLPTVMTKDFNIPENTEKKWLTFEEAVNEQTFDMEKLRNSYAVGGCDLSATTDLTCASLIVRKPDDPNFYVLQMYFLPKARIDKTEASGKTEAPYRLWAERGWLTICEGSTVDYRQVTEWFVHMVREYNIRPLWIGYDAALSGYWKEEMEETGFDMEKIRQGPYTWTYPMKQLKGKFQEGRIIYNNNPMLRWCLLNTGEKSLNRDGIESVQPVKASSTMRIDGMVSLLNAFCSYTNHEEEYMRYVK
ncbi:MAG: terminase large subunit, partial [Clostridia bacterium]|nr:terminase large subunit [Clostridia bacterium]